MDLDPVHVPEWLISGMYVLCDSVTLWLCECWSINLSAERNATSSTPSIIELQK